MYPTVVDVQKMFTFLCRVPFGEKLDRMYVCMCHLVY